jgi:hypothetical protein
MAHESANLDHLDRFAQLDGRPVAQEIPQSGETLRASTEERSRPAAPSA